MKIDVNKLSLQPNDIVTINIKGGKPDEKHKLAEKLATMIGHERIANDNIKIVLINDNILISKLTDEQLSQMGLRRI